MTSLNPQAQPQAEEQRRYMLEVSHAEYHMINGALVMAKCVVDGDPVVGLIGLREFTTFFARFPLRPLAERLAKLHESMTEPEEERL